MENGFRWLTLNPPDQPDLEIVLLDALADKSQMGWDKDSQDALKLLLEKGVMGAGAFYTPDCRATYEELRAKGVKITEPKQQFYGLECIVNDGCGNWFSMTQPAEIPASV